MYLWKWTFLKTPVARQIVSETHLVLIRDWQVERKGSSGISPSLSLQHDEFSNHFSISEKSDIVGENLILSEISETENQDLTITSAW